MSTMHDHQKHGECSKEAYSQYYAPQVPENDTTGGTRSNNRRKSPPETVQASNSNDDDEAQANSDLLAAWTQRLQILTVVTTFLASTDGTLFSLTTLNTQIGLPVGTNARELVYSCLAGALIFHVCACILGYVASFALIRYRMIEPSEEEIAKRLPRRVIIEPVRPLRGLFSLRRSEGLLCFAAPQSPPSPPPSPMSLLTHCYYTTLCLTTAGFTMALTGILAYIWAGLPMIVGIFATICLGIGVGATLWALAT